MDSQNLVNIAIASIQNEISANMQIDAGNHGQNYFEKHPEELAQLKNILENYADDLKKYMSEKYKFQDNQNG